jgi:hypothetical protein
MALQSKFEKTDQVEMIPMVAKAGCKTWFAGRENKRGMDDETGLKSIAED